MQESSEIQRAVRTASRSIRASLSDPVTEDPFNYLAAAVLQLAFALEKLTTDVEDLKRRCGAQPA